jgi:2-amino-4-hydroxy-6-hydroxymethyldihydropteridine diphosphokinase
MITAYIALGSNLQNPEHQLRSALAALTALPDSRLQQVSSVYRSAAVGPGPQPDYLNAVARLLTALPPETLLDALQQQEQAQGRTRNVRWEARTLDLDILLYGNAVIETERLTIPHRALCQRNFVLYPLLQVCPANFVLPDGTDLDTLVRDCPVGDLKKTGLQLQDN